MKIIFLFSGESRSFPFTHIQYNSNYISYILKSYNNFIFTEKFKSVCDYKIYISTDDLHLDNTIAYFNEKNIGNIHLLNTNYYKKNINSPSADIKTHFDKYDNITDWSKYRRYDNSIRQHYKIIDCYNLLINDVDSDINITNCDFIIRLRLDACFTTNLLDILDIFKENPKLDIIMDWDFFAIGKPKIMECYCNGLNNNYGNYTFQTYVPSLPPVVYEYDIMDRYTWTYAPERQLFEMLFEYYNKNGINIHNAIKSISCCNIIRVVYN
jgi:hypothetical protein